MRHLIFVVFLLTFLFNPIYAQIDSASYSNPLKSNFEIVATSTVILQTVEEQNQEPSPFSGLEKPAVIRNFAPEPHILVSFPTSTANYFKTSNLNENQISTLKVFHGEDFNYSDSPLTPQDDPIALVEYPNSKNAQNAFLAEVKSYSIESFENFPALARPTVLSFGSDTANLSGSAQVYVVPGNQTTFNGTWPTTGKKFLMHFGVRTIKISFSSPQNSFGFFTTDLADLGDSSHNSLLVEVRLSDGTTRIFNCPHTTNPGPRSSGSIFFFGFHDSAISFESVSITNPRYNLDGCGYDDFIISQKIPVEVLSVESFPETLWLDPAGVGSGIFFRAVTSEETTVSFKVTAPSGAETIIDSRPTDNKTAKLSWWGTGGMEEGVYTITAQAGDSSKSATFNVKKVGVDLIGLGKWVKTAKDPSAVLPPRAAEEVCPLNPWEEIIKNATGDIVDFSINDPVNTSSGNLALPEVDFTLKGRRSFAVARIYNSLDAKIGAFGRGWSSPLLVNLAISNDHIVFTNSDGAKLLFRKSNNTFTPASRTDLTLEFNPDTEFYFLSHPTGTTWIFDSCGKIVQMLRSCCGQGVTDAIVFSYDISNKLSTLAMPSGKTLSFTYDGNGLITAITDSTGRIFTYGYDENQNLVSFKDALNRETVYAYDESGFLTSYTRPGNRTTEIAYAHNRVALIKDPTGAQSNFAWDLDNRKLVLTDFAGVIHEYFFDEEWRISSYAVPSANLLKEFTATDGRLTALKDSLGHTDGYAYDAAGLYVSHTDKLGNISAFEWHPTFHKLTKKTDSLGRSWSYEWCPRGNLIGETDPAGGTTGYTYDSHNNRTSKTDALGRVTRYVYDSTGNYLIQTIDAMGGISSFTYDLRGNLTSSTDQLGRTSAFEYDLLDRLIKSTYPDGRFTRLSYDEAGNIASRIDNSGRVTAYTYDAAGRMLSTTRPDGTVLSHVYDAAGRKISSTDALGRVTAYEYDALDNMVKVTHPDQTCQTYVYDTEKRLVSSTDELGNLTAYEYDPMGRMLATIDPAGSRYENTYDAAGRRVAAKDPLGRITAFEYDVLDRVVKIVAPDATFNTAGYDAVGNLLVSTNALNQQTVFEYDALNRQVKTTRSNGAQFTTSYDAAGQVISETDALGNTSSNAYDLAGRRVSAANALNHVWQYVYDSAGRLVRTVDPMGGVATMTYDVMDRVVSESDSLGRVNAYEYDLTGKRIARTDAMGRRSIFAYDGRDRLTTEVDGEGRIVSYGYDSAGRKTSLTDGAGRVWRWAYDALGRVVAEIDPLGNEVKSSYDAVGNLVLKTNARAQATAYEYDLVNRLVKIDYPDSTVATFAYDALGRELIRSGSAGVVEKTYDVVGNLLSETFVDQNKGWQYSYDLIGNRIQANSPENEHFKFSYDQLYRKIKLETGKSSEEVIYTYDALGRNIEEKRVDSTTSNRFDAAGQLLETKHYRLVPDHAGNGCGHGHKHNRKKEPVYKEEILALRQYDYDPAGNRISMTDENGKVTSYAYDNGNWLTQVVYPNNDVVTYAYNGAGDRISEKLNDEPAVDYSYDSAGRMLSRADESFSYDADGNMLTDALATYTWNSDNRLVKVEKTIDGCKHNKDRKGHGFGHLKHGKETVIYEEYAYLPMDWRRVLRKTGKYNIDRRDDSRIAQEEKIFVSIYDGDDESHEYLLTEAKFKLHGKCRPGKEDLKLFREFVGGPSADDMSHTRYGKLSFAMLKDGLGSTIALTGKEARPIARINYDAWGNFRWHGKDCENSPCTDDDFDEYLDRLEGIRSFGHGNHNGWAFGRHFGSRLTPYLYTGRRYSEISNQTWHRNRYYSPALGRFTTKDPIGFNGGINLYRYADNNPMRYTDPTGLFIAETLAVLTVKEILIGTGLFGDAVYFNTPEGKKTLTDFVQKLQSGATWTKEKIQDAFNSVTCELLPDAAAEQIYLASANDSDSGNSGDDSGSNNTSDPNDPKDPRQKVIEALDQIFKNHRFTREEISTAVDRITRFIQQYEMHDPRVAAIIRQVIEEILGRRN